MRLLFVDRSTRLNTVSDLRTRPRGGMVSSLFEVTDYLSREHDVTVFSDIENEGITKAGTKWLREAFGQYDVLVANRGIGSGFDYIDAKARVLWTHDLPHNGFIPEPKRIKAFDCTVFMSRYAERVWRTFYRDIGRSVIIPNGVSAIFHPREKEHDTLIYASAPNRGLENLPLILDAIRSRVGREVRLRAFSNLSSLHPNEVGKGDTFDYQPVKDSAVELMDPVPQADLAGFMGQAGLMILPTGYPEICSNIVLQSLKSGTPIITTGGLGATPEWVKHRENGMLTTTQPADYMVHTVEMVRNAVEVLENRRLHERLIRTAARAPIFSWQEIGKTWERLLHRIC